MERFCVATKQFYVAIELAMVRRIYVATEDFLVTTELATTESSVAHDRAGREGTQPGFPLPNLRDPRGTPTDLRKHFF